MSEETSRFFANNPMIRVRGQDELYPICDDDGLPFDSGASPGQKQIYSASVQARIYNAVFYPEDARPITGVLRFTVTGGPSMSIDVEVP